MNVLKTILSIFGVFLNCFCFSNDFYDQYQNKAKDIVKHMSTEQKIGQMLLPTFDFLTASKGPDALAEARAAWFVETDLIELGKVCGFEAITDLYIGAVLQPGGPLTYSGDDQSLPQWQKVTQMANLFYSGPEGTNLLLGTDSVHGDQHVTGSILFPHNIGLGATHDKKLIQQVGYWTRRNMQSSGFNWSFSPTVAIGHDYRWGRLYECYSSNLSVIKALASHYIIGLQGIEDDKLITGVLGTVKHFIADGDTRNGMDEGYAFSKSLRECWKNNGAGYEGAVQASVGSMMVSYSSLNNIPMHFGGAFNLLSRFRDKGIRGTHGKIYQLGGFVVSDYVGVSRAAYKCLQTSDKCHLINTTTNNNFFELYVEAIAKSVNAGVDMFMIANNAAYIDPFDYEKEPPYSMKSPLYYNQIKTVADALSQAVSSGLISHKKLNEVVTRIIRVKLSMASPQITDLSDKDISREAKISLRAAEESLVLLKNKEHTLPVRPDLIKHVFLIGAYDDIGSQNGGWTVNWQGQKGNKYWLPESSEKAASHASSILDGVRSILGSGAVFYEGEEMILNTNFDDVTTENSIAIVAIGEPPYAEYNEDVDNGNPWYLRGILMGENSYMSPIQSTFLGIHLTHSQLKAIKHLKKNGVKIATVLFSGRPLVITDGKKGPLSHSDAFIAAFLPGTSGGQAIANGIFGKFGFKSTKSRIGGKVYHSNTLPFAWPASMKEVTRHRYTLYPVGYGLKTHAF